MTAVALTRWAVLLALLGVGAVGFGGVLAWRDSGERPEAPDSGEGGDGPWARVILRVDGMS